MSVVSEPLPSLAAPRPRHPASGRPFRVDEAAQRPLDDAGRCFAAALLTIGFPVLFSVDRPLALGPHRCPSERADRQPARHRARRRPRRPARDRCARRARDQRRVLDGDDPRVAHRRAAAAARALGEGRRVRRHDVRAVARLGAPGVLRRARRSSAPPLLQIAFSHPGVARTVVCGAVFLTLIAACSRSRSARSCATPPEASPSSPAILFVIPPLLLLLPSGWQDAISPYLPSSAGDSIVTLHPTGNSLSPSGGFFVLAGYVVAALVAAAVLLRRRDA